MIGSSRGAHVDVTAMTVQNPGRVDDTRWRFLARRQRLSLRRNVSWALFGNGAVALSQWALVVLLTKRGDVEMVGRYALASAIAVPVMVLANMNLRGILATDARGKYQPRHFVVLRYLTSLAATVLVLAGASLSGASRTTMAIIALVTIGQAATSIQDIYRGLMQRAERMDVVAVSAFLQASTTLAAAWLVLRSLQNLAAVLVAIAVSRLLVLYAYDRPVARALAVNAERVTVHTEADARAWNPLLRLARTAFPVGIAMVMVSVNTNIPRYALEHYWGDLELGYFATLMAIPFAGTIVVAALGDSAAPRLGLYWRNDHRAFRTLLGRLGGMTLVLGGSGAALAWAFAKPILTTVFRPEYVGREHAFIWVMIAGGVTYVYSILGYGLIAVGRFRAQLAISTAVATTTTVLSHYLVPPYGVTGAAWAVLGASVIGTFATITLVERTLEGAARAGDA